MQSVAPMFVPLCCTLQQIRMKRNIMKKTFVALFVLLVVPVVCPAQWVLMKTDADRAVHRGIDHIYNLQFDSASAEFEYVIEKYPDHPVGYFMEAMVDWWKIDTRTDFRSPQLEEQFLAKIDRVIAVSDQLLEKNNADIVGLFFKGGAIGYRGRYYATVDRSWIKALADGKEALGIIQQSWNIAPGNKDVLLGMGLYHYIAAVFPDEYPVIKPLMAFFPAGDRRGGLLELKLAAEQARYANVEAKVALLQIYYQFEKDYQASLDLAKELFDKYPRNARFHRYLANSYVRLGYNDLKEQTWREILIRVMNKQTGYDYKLAREAMYYIGDALISRGEYDQALKYLYKTDEFNRELDSKLTGWMVQTNIKIGNIYDLQGKRDLAVKQYNKVLSWEDYDDKSHEQARKYLEKPYGK